MQAYPQRPATQVEEAFDRLRGIQGRLSEAAHDDAPEAIDRYLASPATAVPGNNMAFIGLPKAEDRQAVLAYLAKATVVPDPAANPTQVVAPAVLTLKKAN